MAGVPAQITNFLCRLFSGSLFTKLLRYVFNPQFVYKSCAISMSAQSHEVFIDSQPVDQRPKSLSNSVSGSRRTIGRP